MKTWIEEAFESEWVKMTEGVHELEILEPPERERSELTGKQQWVFQVKIDGDEGKFAPSKRLLRLVAAIVDNNGIPVKMTVKRTGLDIKTQYEILKVFD